VKRNLLVAAVLGASLVVIAAVLAGCVTVNTGPKASSPAPAQSSSTPAGFAVGQSVAAVWTDSNLYLATITKVEGDKITVQYADDQSTKTVASSDVKAIPRKTWAAGDKVLAVWTSGRFYPGEVTREVGASYEVKWDDGSAPSDVTAEKIIAR
jgi:hypothetical protein